MIRLDQGEPLRFLTRRHPLPALGAAAAGSAALLVVAVGVLLSGVEPVALPGGLACILLAGGSFALTYARYRRDVVLVTDRRLVHRSGLLRVTSSETATERIGDVRISTGITGRFLGYGDVEVLADADLGIDILRSIRDPEGLAAALRAARRPDTSV